MSKAPPTTRRRGTFLAEVLANERLCDEHYLLRLALERLPETRPGQFVQVQCSPPRPHPRPRAVDWPADRPPRLSQPDLVGAEALLRRPFSLAGRRNLPGGGVELEIIYRVVGSGTGWLGQLAAGAPVSVLGPLGNAFTTHDDRPAAALIGGGVGIPPMIYLGRLLRRLGKTTTAFCGVRSAALLPLKLTAGPAGVSAAGDASPCAEAFAAEGIAAAITTDDGSLGARGFVHETFRRWLDAQVNPAERLVAYACGPEPMMRAVGELCVARGVPCQLALERHMACGMGTCQSCVCKIRAHNDRGWAYKLVCTDGPVFEAGSIVWD